MICLQRSSLWEGRKPALLRQSPQPHLTGMLNFWRSSVSVVLSRHDIKERYPTVAEEEGRDNNFGGAHETHAVHMPAATPAN